MKPGWVNVATTDRVQYLFLAFSVKPFSVRTFSPQLPATRPVASTRKVPFAEPEVSIIAACFFSSHSFWVCFSECRNLYA